MTRNVYRLLYFARNKCCAYLFLLYVFGMKRENQLLIRLSDEEKLAFEQAAELSGVKTSSWARQKLRIVAAKELRDADKPVAFLEEVIS